MNIYVSAGALFHNFFFLISAFFAKWSGARA